MTQYRNTEATPPIARLDAATPDLARQNVKKLAALFPDCVTEGPEGDGPHIDFNLLKQALSGHLVEGPQERYRLDWPGKRQAMLLANQPTTKTLRPMREDSVDFDTTRNLFIEGDNLEALKILQETYLGRVKMIYIDPPYNTGKDFIYRDNFRRSAGEELEASGQADEDGRLVANTEANGRFHSAWLSMMAPRLKLARSLLRDDGFFVMSCDSAELARAIQLLDEQFGEANKIAEIVWDRNRKNDAKFFSVGHEYMLVYSKDVDHLKSVDTVLRLEKPGVEEVEGIFSEAFERSGGDFDAIKKELRLHFKDMDENDPRLPMKRYTKVDGKGPYRDDGNINWPGGGGPKYEILHPDTGKAVKLPRSGWRYPSKKRFWEEYEAGKIVFGPDETTVPSVRSNLFESRWQVMGSVAFSYAQTAANEFDDLFEGNRIFDNPKSFRDLSTIIRYMSEDDDIVLDFFAGSGSFAHANFQAFCEDGKSRRSIVVQIAEDIVPPRRREEETADRAAALLSSLGRKHTISEVTKERIRRAGAKILAANPDLKGSLDVGFRAFRIDGSNFHDTRLTVADAAAVATDDAKRADLLDGLTAHIKDDRSDEDLLFGALLAWGVDITLPVRRETVEGRDVLLVDAPDDTAEGAALIGCFARDVDTDLAAALAALKPLRVVFRDDGFEDDATKENVASRFKQLAPDTTLRVL